MTRMPSRVEIDQTFGGGGLAGIVQSTNRQLIDQERKGRHEREAQPATGTVQVRIKAEFSEDTPDRVETDWIDFGEMAFTSDPYFFTGSMRLAQAGEPTLAADGSNFDPAQHFTVPGTAMVLVWRVNDQGLYTGAKLVLCAEGSVPAGYKVLIYGLFIGPCVRMG